MKIAYIVNHLVPYQLYGTEVATDHYARYLSERGHEVHVIIIRERGIPEFEARSDRYFVHSIPFTRKLSYTMGEIIYFMRILLLIKKIGPDLIHAQMLQNGRFTALIRMILGIPVIVASRGDDIYTKSDLYKRTIGRFILSGNDLVLALTEHMKRTLLEVKEREIIVVPNGIDINLYSGLIKEDMRRTLHLPEDRRIMLFLGRFVDKKCPLDVIRAFVEIRAEIEDITLVMVGDGELRGGIEGEIKKLGIADCVILTGRVARDEIPKYIVAADIMIQPSRSEGFPNTFVEAFGGNLPILTSDDGGNPEIVINGFAGLVSPLHDHRTLGRNGIRVLMDEELLSRLSGNAGKRARDFQWDVIIDRLEKIYLDLVNKKVVFGDNFFR